MRAQFVPLGFSCAVQFKQVANALDELRPWRNRARLNPIPAVSYGQQPQQRRLPACATEACPNHLAAMEQHLPHAVFGFEPCTPILPGLLDPKKDILHSRRTDRPAVVIVGYGRVAQGDLFGSIPRPVRAAGASRLPTAAAHSLH